MLQDTSLHAYALATQNLGAKQKQVLDALRFFPDATNAEIAAHMQIAINRVTPRMGELRKQGLVLEAGRRTCKVTGGTAHAWVAKHPVLPPAFKEKTVEQTNPQSLF
jgi:predicted transcriptional regulator